MRAQLALSIYRSARKSRDIADLRFSRHDLLQPAESVSFLARFDVCGFGGPERKSLGERGA